MNWKQRCDRARKNCGTFRMSDKKASCSYRQCAIGVALHNIGYRHPHAFFSVSKVIRKVDEILFRKGMEFNNAVRWDYVDRAEELYDEIQNYPISQKLKDSLRIKDY